MFSKLVLARRQFGVFVCVQTYLFLSSAKAGPMSENTIPPPPPEPPIPTGKVEGAWQFIEPILAERHKPLLDDLRPGATDAELDAAEQHMSVTLPPEFRAFYKGHDGQNGKAPGFFFGAQFLSISEVVKKWDFWQQLLSEDPGTYGKAGDSKSVPEGAIDTRYIFAKWIPFADDRSGNHLGLDFGSGPRGVTGQCITFGRDQHTKFVVGKSFDAFIGWVQPRFWGGHSEFKWRTDIGDGVMTFDLVAPGAPDMIGLMTLLHEH